MILWTLVLGGILQVLLQWTRLQAGAVALSAAGLVIVFGILEKIMKVYKRQSENFREIALYYRGSCIHIRGFADTGNQLRDPFTMQPVSIVSKETWEELLLEQETPLCRMIPYKTVGNANGLLQSVQIDYMAISEGKESKIIERPIIALTEQPFAGIFHYSILLHSDYC